jgi:hypothetical protein
MDDAFAWTMEERFWTGGIAHYGAALHLDCVMAFPAPVGIMSGSAILDSLAGAPRWSEVTFADRAMARIGEGALVLGYRARAIRPGTQPYEAFCTSTYVGQGRAGGSSSISRRPSGLERAAR